MGEPKRGKWVVNHVKHTVMCTNCKSKLTAHIWLDMIPKWSYCPYCGAFMKDKGEG